MVFLRLATLVFSILFVIPAIAQDDPRLAQGSRYLVRKNELGTNLAPASVFVLGGRPVYPKFTVAFKRRFELKDGRHLAWRTGFVNISSYVPGDTDPLADSYLVQKLDTLETRLVREDQIQNIGGYAGMEWRFPGRTLQVFTGFDLYFRTISQNAVVYRKNFVVDQFCLDGNCEPKEVLSQKTGQANSRMSEFGIGPFAGLLLPITRRLIIATTIGFEAGYRLGTQVLQTENHEIFPDDVNEGYFAVPYIVRDLTLYLRF